MTIVSEFPNYSGYLRFGDGLSYVQIDGHGELTLVGGATVYNDANVGSLVLVSGGTLPGVVEWVDNLGAGSDIFTRGFAVNESGSGSIEIPHDYKEGTDLTFHIHWGVNDAPSGTDYVKWQVIYSITGAGVTTPPIATLVGETAIATRYDHKLTDLSPVISGAALKIGMQVNFTISRIAAVGAAFSGEALAETIGFHYQCDGFGSKTIITK